MRHSLAREFKACWLIAVIVSPTALLAQPARVDHLGDPMPEGAITRLGSARLYHTGRDENRGMSIFSPDGIFLATVTPSGAKIWETRTGRKLGTIYLSATDSPVAAFSADSRSIAIATAGMVGVYPVIGDHKFVYSKPAAKDSRRVDWLAFLPKRSGIAFVENRGDICVTDNRGLERFRISLAAANPVAGLAADGTTLTIWNQENVDRWDLSKRTKIATVRFPYLSSFGKLRMRGDGSLFALELRSGGVIFWDPSLQKETGRLADSKLDADAGTEFTPDGKQLVTMTRQKTTALVQRWEIATGKLLKAFPIPIEDAGDPAASPDGKAIAFTIPRPPVPLLDLQTGKRLFQRPGLEEPAVSLSFVPGGRLIAAGGRLIRTWETVNAKLVGSIGLPFDCDGLAVDRSGDWGVVVGAGQVNPRICSFRTGEIGDELQLPPMARIDSGALAIVDSLSAVVALGWTGKPAAKVRFVWDLGTRMLAPIEKEPKASSWRALAGPYRLRLIPPANQDEFQQRIPEIAVHALTDNRLLLKVDPTGYPDRVASNGQLLAAVLRASSEPAADSEFTHLEVWEIVSGEHFRFAPEAKTKSHFSILAMAPDGRSLAIVDGHNELALIETYTGKRLSSFNVENVRCLAFSADGRYLASGQGDGTVLIWDVASAMRHRTATRVAKPEEFDQAWRDLARNAVTARVAMDRLRVDSERTIEFLRDRLRPAAAPPRDQVQRWVADLNSPKFATREAASRELAKLRQLLRSEIQAARDSTHALEVKRRLERILVMPRPARTADELRQLRAIELLEGFNNRDAVGVLRLIASGDPRAPQTQAAKEALERLQP